MNTQIYLWVEPMVMNHERCSDKVYFDCVINGDHAKSEAQELEELIQGEIMSSIMNFADIDVNWDYGVVSARATNKKPAIEFSHSPEERIEEKEVAIVGKAIAKIVRSKKPIELTKKNVEIKDDAMIEVSVPSLRVNDKIDFKKIWASLEKNFIGKIKEGDSITLIDDNGNIIFEMLGGNFLNAGLSDLLIYDKKKNPNPSMFNWDEGFKGGAYLRDDGSIDVGDHKRTFYLKIYTNNLLKAALKLNKSLMDITKIKLLK